MEMSILWLKYMYSVLSAFTWKSMPPAAHSRLYSRDSAWSDVFARSTMSSWKADLTDKLKRSFFQAAVVSILLYGCTTWMLTKLMEKKLDGNCTKMLRAILNKCWRQYSSKKQLYGHLPPITKTIQVRRTGLAGHCWRNKNKLICDVLQWTPSCGRAKVQRPARTYLQQFCADKGCSLEDLPGEMVDRDEWRESVRVIRTSMMMMMMIS